MIPSGCHRTILRRLHGGITRDSMATRGDYEGFPKSCCLPKTIGQLLVSFVLSSGSEKCPMGPMNTRRWHDLTRCHHDGHTKVKMDTRTQHEYEPSQEPSGIFWHAKDFVITPEVAAEGWKTPPKVIRWLKMSSRMARWCYGQSRSDPILNISLIVWPSGTNIGTVWRPHKRCNIVLNYKVKLIFE